jgi:hypothetical protein
MPEERDNLSRTKDWLTIAAILAGGIWALWIFVFDKIIEPRQAPQNLNIDAHLQRDGERNGLLALQVDVSVKNQSSRTVYIPEAAMLLTGHTIQRAAPTSEAFVAEVNKRFELRKGNEFSRSFSITQKESDVIGAGSFLTDWNLEPNEITSRHRVMYVDPSNYDQIVLTSPRTGA